MGVYLYNPWYFMSNQWSFLIMKYIIGTIFALFTVILVSLVVTCVVLTFTSSVLYAFVALGIAFPAVVAFAGTTAAFSAVKDY
jgi:energy-converting hydrogenase Eha subunit A